MTILNDAAVDDAVTSYLDRISAAEHFAALDVDPATGTADSRTAHVVLTAVVHPPIVNFVVPEGIPIAVVSDARSELRR